MNSRSGVNESNLVNIPADLSNLNQITQNRKEPLLSFPFDHLYACHSERQTVELDKEVEISTHCAVPEDKSSAESPNSELGRLADQLSVVETQNRKLKDLLVYHLDLIQQQNDALTKKDKLYQALQIENETLKHKLSQSETKPPTDSRQTVNPQPLDNIGLSSVTSTVVKKEPNSSPQIMFDSLSELLLPDNRNNPYIFNSNESKNKVFTPPDSFNITRSSDADLASFLPTDLELPSMSLLDPNINCDNFTMIESKPPSSTKKEIKTEPRPEPLYTVTTSSGNPIIQKIQRNRRSTSGGLGSLSRMPKKTNVPESSQILRDDKKVERTFSLNKKCKMINTYGKSRSSSLKRTSQFTGSLSDRLRLIDTTPTGEDPYQLGEADMREQSPIPKLMLQKGSHRMRTCTSTSTGTSTRRIYDPAITDNTTKLDNKLNMDNSYNMPCTFIRSSDIKTEPPMNLMSDEPDLDIVKTEPVLHWSMYATSKTGNETSLCDFSYGENSNNLSTNLLTDLDGMDFPDFFTSDSPLNLDNITPVDFNATVENKSNEKTKKRAARTTSLIGPNVDDEIIDNKRPAEIKRGRKRAYSVTATSKTTKQSTQKATGAKPKTNKGKAAANRGKKSPVPGMMTRNTYHTLMGDPDLSWYLGLNPDIKSEDIDPPEINKASTVEVPRWREKPYTSCYALEGTENLDDKVFEKRHQKLEADERRQLRWHMRRIREQRHVERLRQRQRDPWCGNHYQTHTQPSVYTIWPQPQRDIRVIEITDTLPVMAFGESLPELPETDFMLPWVRTSKALKRSKRSKTLH